LANYLFYQIKTKKVPLILNEVHVCANIEYDNGRLFGLATIENKQATNVCVCVF